MALDNNDNLKKNTLFSKTSKSAKSTPPKRTRITLRDGSCLADRKAAEKAALKEKAVSFAASPSFTAPYSSWDDEEMFILAYIALCEGWGTQVDENRGIEALKAGYELRLFAPSQLLGEAYHHGYYSQPSDVKRALTVLRGAFDMADTDARRAVCALSIGYAYTDFKDTCWSSIYAIPWLQLYYAYGGAEDRRAAVRAKNLLQACKDAADPYPADVLVNVFNNNIYVFHHHFDTGKFILTRGQVGNIAKNPFNGEFYMELMSSFPVELPPDPPDDVAQSVRCFMKDSSELAGLTQGESVRLMGRYSSERGPALLFTDCELYKPPLFEAPPAPPKKSTGSKGTAAGKTSRASKSKV